MNDSIVIQTELNTSGFSKGSKALKTAISALSGSAKKLGSQLGKIPTMLLGVGSAFAVITKAASTFMQQNEKLSARMGSIWTALGNLLGPVIEQLVNWVASAVSQLLAFLKLLGVTSKTASQLSKSAKGAAGDLKKTIAGFDELNTLQESGGSGSGAGALEDLEPPAWMTDLAEFIKNGQWDKIAEMASAALIAGFNKLGDAIASVDWKEIGSAIRDFFGNIDYKGIADAIFGVLRKAWRAALDLLWGVLAGDTLDKPPLIASLERIGESLATLYQAIKDFVSQAWEDVLKPVLEWTVTEGLPAVLDVLAVVIQKVADLIEKHGPLIESILIGIGATIVTLDIIKKVQGFMKVLNSLWGVLMANPIALVIGAVAAFVAAIAIHGDEIQEILQKVDDWLQGVFSKDWTEIFGPVLGNALNGFFATVKGIWDGIKQVFDGIIDFIRGVFTGDWKRAWEGVKEIFGGIFSTLGSLLKAPINGILSLINSVIDGINWLIEQANGLGAVVGFHINTIGHIPYLAKGGVLEKGQIGLLEGDGAEAVVPLEKNTEWIGKVAEGFTERIQKGNYFGEGIGTLAAMRAIERTVSFRTPALAAGTVLPYSVQSGFNGSGAGASAEETTGLREDVQEIRTLLRELGEEMRTIQFVAQFDNIRALARRITKEQRRDMIAEGK